MNREEAIRKLEYSKKAYQRLIDEKVDSGKLVGKDVRGEWKADTPLDEAYKSMIDALEIAIKALEQEPCDDAISRQDALRAFMYAINGERLPDYDCDNYPVTYDLRYIKKTLRALSPVTPQPKTGHWMIDEDSTDRFFATYECSCCKRAIIVPRDAMKAVYKDYPFCHCGAKMGKGAIRNERVDKVRPING